MRAAALLLAAALGLPGVAASQTWDSQRPAVLTLQANGQVTMAPGPAVTTAITPRTYINAGNGLNAMRDPSFAPSPRGAVPATVVRTFPWGSVAKGVARALPGISTAIAIAQLLDEVRCREAFGGGPECDLGQATVPTQGFDWCRDNAVTTPSMCGHTDPLADYRSANAGYIAAQCGSGFACTGLLYADRGSGTLKDFAVWASGPGFSGWVGTIPHKTYGRRSVTVQTCPAINIGGNLVSPSPGRDGKCPTLTYTPKPVSDLETIIETHGNPTRAPAVVPELIARGLPVPHDAPSVQDVSPTPWERTRTDKPDGSVTVRDRRFEADPEGSSIRWREVIVERDYAPGATIPAPGGVTGGTSTSAPPGEEKITCGLPGTPPCKIDESGTPDSVTITKAEVEASKAEALAKIAGIGAVAAPAWTWAFALPTTCQGMSVGPFFGRMVDVDLCPYQPLIHSIVALLWIAGAIWACVAMVGRTLASG